MYVHVGADFKMVHCSIFRLYSRCNLRRKCNTNTYLQTQDFKRSSMLIRISSNPYSKFSKLYHRDPPFRFDIPFINKKILLKCRGKSNKKRIVCPYNISKWSIITPGMNYWLLSKLSLYLLLTDFKQHNLNIRFSSELLM